MALMAHSLCPFDVQWFKCFVITVLSFYLLQSLSNYHIDQLILITVDFLGHLMRLTYFVSPYDLLDVEKKQTKELSLKGQLN